MKWSKPRKEKSATQQALLELAAKCRKLRMQGETVPQEMEVEYRQLLAQNYAELR
jgi:hypothetical protein